MSNDIADILNEIITNYPETEWLERCKTALPDTDVGAIQSIIEVLCGGDLEEI